MEQSLELLKKIIFKTLLVLAFAATLASVIGIWVEIDSETTGKSVGSLALIGGAAFLAVIAVKIRNYLSGTMGGKYPLLKLAAILFIGYLVLMAMVYIALFTAISVFSSGLGGGFF